MIEDFQETTDRLGYIDELNKLSIDHKTGEWVDSVTYVYRAKDLYYETAEVTMDIPLNDGYHNPNDSNMQNVFKTFNQMSFNKLIIIGTNDTVSYSL